MLAMDGLLERADKTSCRPDSAAPVPARMLAETMPDGAAQCRTVADLRSCLERFARRFGFYGCRYVHVGHAIGVANDERPARFLTSSREADPRATDDWLSSDPAVARMRSAYAPFTWSSGPTLDATEPQRRWLSVERARGVGGGIVIPVQDHAAGPAYLSLFGMDEAAAAQVLNRNEADLALSAAAFHAAAKDLVPLTQGMNVSAALTRREIECLRFAAMGQTSSASGRTLGIAARTVEFHLRNAGEKLGAVNKIHAVAIAVSLKLIRI